MATQSEVEKLRAVAERITARPIQELLRNAAWGSINFDKVSESLEMLFGLADQMQMLPVELLPAPQIASFTQVFTESAAAVDGVAGFTLETANPTGTRDSLVLEVRRTTDNTLTHVQSWIPFLAYQRGDVQKNISDLNVAVKDAKGILQDAKVKTTATAGEIDGIITAARDASASVGVAHFTTDFSGQATRLEGDAKLWLGWTAALAIVSAGAALLSFLVPIDKDASNAQVLQYLTSKLVLLGVLVTATVWCGRIYRATKHQAAVCSHRANALKSFQAFVKATADEGTRNAVLLETTRSIFALSPSGYLDSVDSSGDGGSKVLEIIKGASGGGKS